MPTTGRHLLKWLDKRQLHSHRLVSHDAPGACAFRDERGALVYAHVSQNKHKPTGAALRAWVVRHGLEDAVLSANETDATHAFPMKHPFLYAHVVVPEPKLYRVVTRDAKKRPVSVLQVAPNPTDALLASADFLRRQHVEHVRVLHLTDEADLTDTERRNLPQTARALLEHAPTL